MPLKSDNLSLVYALCSVVGQNDNNFRVAVYSRYLSLIIVIKGLFATTLALDMCVCVLPSSFSFEGAFYFRIEDK